MTLRDATAGEPESCVDARLVTRLCQGDRVALTTLVRRWEVSMLRLAYRIVGQIQDAEEVRQTVLARLVEDPHRVNAPDKFAAWIHRCVVNESISLIRRRRSKRVAEQAVAANTSDATPDPAAKAIKNDELQQLRTAMDSLAPECRALLALRFDRGLTVRAIGEVLELPHTTVQTRLQKAIQSLRVKLDYVNQ